LTLGLGIIILQGVSRRKSLAGVNIMCINVKIVEIMTQILHFLKKELSRLAEEMSEYLRN
jgi:hypothetical protein